jgi:hypothetical protein
VDLIVTIGYYSMVALCIKALEVELDEGLKPGLPV